MIFDPVLNELLENDAAETNGNSITWRQPPMCNHCYRRIEGKVYLSNNKYYDSYCWGMRAVLDSRDVQSKSRSSTNSQSRSNIKSK